MTGRYPIGFAAMAASTVLVLVVALALSPTLIAIWDRTAPTRPTNLHVTAKTSFSVSLAWSPSTDNFGAFSYVIRASNGQDIPVNQTATSFHWDSGLLAGYDYSFTIYAIDQAGNRSSDSNTVNVMLPADVTPPTAPSELWWIDRGCGEIRLSWTPSTDNEDPQAAIRYDVYVNGTLNHSLARRAHTVLSAGVDGSNTFQIFAVDSAGNTSAPASVTLELDLCRF